MHELSAASPAQDEWLGSAPRLVLVETPTWLATARLSSNLRRNAAMR
jgi:hypothetical protein